MEKTKKKRLREPKCCFNCEKSKWYSSCDSGCIICEIDGAEESNYMICDFYEPQVLIERE